MTTELETMRLGLSIRSDPDRLLSVEEVAELLGMSTAWVRQHSNGMRRPSIPSIKLGKCVRSRRQDVQEFVESMARPTV